jgi:hypothetical protein
MASFPETDGRHLRRKLQTRAGRAIYAARKTIVEPVYGQIKEARGFRRFLLRGLAKVRGEWALVCLTHNLIEVARGIPGIKPRAIFCFGCAMLDLSVDARDARDARLSVTRRFKRRSRQPCSEFA